MTGAAKNGVEKVEDAKLRLTTGGLHVRLRLCLSTGLAAADSRLPNGDEPWLAGQPMIKHRHSKEMPRVITPIQPLTSHACDWSRPHLLSITA